MASEAQTAEASGQPMSEKVVVYIPDALATWVDARKHIIDPCGLLEKQLEMTRIRWDDGQDVGSSVPHSAPGAAAERRKRMGQRIYPVVTHCHRTDADGDGSLDGHERRIRGGWVARP